MRKLTTVTVSLVLVMGGAVFWLTRHLQAPEPSAASGAMVQVRVPDLTAVALEGQVLFRGNCAMCHGDLADGREGLGPPLVHKIYEPGHHSDGSFFLAAAQGVRSHHWRFGNMPPVDTVSQDDVGKIVAYVRSLQRANGIY
nr:cytochrome c [uncultured Roseibium sp.]